MLKKHSLFILLFLQALWLLADVPPKIRRICRDPSSTDNLVFFFPGNDTCNGFTKYFVHARNGASGPFFLLDSIFDKNAETYRHVNANPGTPTVWYYFLEYIDTCGPDYSTFSDTVAVDLIPPDTVLIDSVSIDITTNTVQIGWKNNRAPDFLNFILYRIDAGGIYTNLSGTGTRDTFWVDNTINPRNIAYLYDLLSRDSCTNPQVFGINAHKPVLLSYSVDTCAKSVSLSWTGYVGWPVRSYYIYENTGSGFILLDSVPGNVFSYQKNIPLGIPHQYFLRAFADTSFLRTSSSNDISFTTRLRTDPDIVWLKNVSFTNMGETPVTLTADMPTAADVSMVRVNRWGSSGLQTFDIPGNNLFPFTWNDPTAAAEKYQYQLWVYGLCGVPNAYSDTLENLILLGEQDGEDALLTWDNGPNWNEGVSNYDIYRAVVDDPQNINYGYLASVTGNNTYRDVGAISLAGANGVYYIITATQNPGSPWGDIELSYSNEVSVTGELKLYVPNAFVPSGVNKIFRPEGMFIDYVKSSMSIYNRWGELIFEKTDITAGWDGTDSSGAICPIDVYLYEITIFDLNGRSVKQSGTVTLLN